MKSYNTSDDMCLGVQPLIKIFHEKFRDNDHIYRACSIMIVYSSLSYVFLWYVVFFLFHMAVIARSK